MKADGLHVLLYLASQEGVTPLLDFARVNLPPLASRLTLAASEPRCLLRAAPDLDLPGTLPLRIHRLPEAGSACLAAACEELGADLVVAAAPSEQSSWPLGRVDWGVLERPPVPVVWARGRARRIRRILLAASGTEDTLVDAAVLARLATPLEATVTALHVRPRPSRSGPPRGEADEHARILAEVGRHLTDLGVPAETEIREGPVVETVLRALREEGHDLLVVGAHSESGLLDRLMQENLTRDLAGAAPLPVLVARIWPVRRPR